MRCAACGREVERRPGETCPVCGEVLGPEQTDATPESTVQGFGRVMRGVRGARTRSSAVQVGGLLILLALLLVGSAWAYSLLAQAGGQVTPALLLPTALVLLTCVVAWRWYR